MGYKVFRTGFGALDEMLGGGIIEDGILLIVYNTGSYGWALGVEVFKAFLARGWYGVVTNYSLPYSLLRKYAMAVRFGFQTLGREDRLAVVDVFGSVNGIQLREPFVYSVGQVDGSTFLPKMLALYKTLISNRPKRIGLTVTMDGFVEVFGEDTGMRILKKNMAIKESYPRAGGEEVLNIFLINRDRVSPRFLSWLSQYSEHIVELRPTERPGVENIHVVKSLLPDFEPSTGIFRFKKGRVEILPTLRD
ncbi:hypothetical protein [Thermococcus sp. 21S9]|uniref:hypothetical protein n=1 Tax=Thermococcus sp. 21S9 TaxID=1638223 RepID=UPI00143BE78A|nr:hypothetical protein [Thermococcus sp. 21S9]NJE54436.1 hypothetical protein [Thermococcus sp. 21S9]